LVATIQPFKPPLELYELHVSIIVEDVEPYTKMKNMTMGISKERNIIPVSCG
jgi:hypothetical protein